MSVLPNIMASLTKVTSSLNSAHQNAFKAISAGLGELAKPQVPLPPAAAEVIKGDLTKLATQIKWFDSVSVNLKDAARIVEPSISGKFRTQAGASNYIADRMTSYGNGPTIDKKVQDAVRDACNRWRPGQDLAAMCRDAVKAALKGHLPDSYTPRGFEGPKTPDAVADMVAAQIRANGASPIAAAEHMVAAEKAYRPPA